MNKSKDRRKVKKDPVPERKIKKVPHGPVPIQLSTPKRPASSPKESDTPKRNKYSPGNSPSFSSVASSPLKRPLKNNDSRKSAQRPSTAPIPFEFPKRTSVKSTVKLSKSLTFTSKEIDPPKFTFSLTPPSVRDVNVPSTVLDFPPLSPKSTPAKGTTPGSPAPNTTSSTPAPQTTPDTASRPPLLATPTSNNKESSKPSPITHINNSQTASTSKINRQANHLNDSQIASTSNASPQANATHQTHAHSKNINSFYIYFELKDWESERAIITQLQKQYPQLEVSYIGKHNTSITIKAHNKQSFIVLANISSLNNKTVKFIPKEPYTPTLTSTVLNFPLTSDPKTLISIPQITSVERIHQWDPINKTKNPTTNIKVGYQALNIPSQITLDSVTYEIKRYIPAPAVCGKCCRIGHQAHTCKSTSQTCHICSGPHPKKSCPNPTNKKCLNCGNAHSANYRGCPAIKAAAHQISTSINPQPLMKIRVPRYPLVHHPSFSHLNPYFPPPRCTPPQYPHSRYPPRHSPLQFVPHSDPPRRNHYPHSPSTQPTYAAMAHPHKPASSTPHPVQQTKTPQKVPQSPNKETQHQRSQLTQKTQPSQNARNQNKETQHQRPRSVHQPQPSPNVPTQNLNKETQHQKPNPVPPKTNNTHKPIPTLNTPTPKYPIVQMFSKQHSLDLINELHIALNQAIKKKTPLTDLFQTLLVTLQSAHFNLRSVHGPPTMEQMEMNIQEFINTTHLIFKELHILTL